MLTEHLKVLKRIPVSHGSFAITQITSRTNTTQQLQFNPLYDPQMIMIIMIMEVNLCSVLS